MPVLQWADRIADAVFHRSRSRLATEQLNTSPVSLLPRRPQPENCAFCGRRGSNVGRCVEIASTHLSIIYASVLTPVIAAGTILCAGDTYFSRAKRVASRSSGSRGALSRSATPARVELVAARKPRLSSSAGVLAKFHRLRLAGQRRWWLS